MVVLKDLDTPFIYVDVDIVKQNIERMQRLVSSHNKKLRPHIKTHKLPLFAHWQIQAGAVGVCVQKTEEAEVMVRHGISDVLISNEVIGRQKTDRVAILAQLSKIHVAVDSELGLRQISDSAREAGEEVGVFIDVDVGMERCGVKGEQAAKLAQLASKTEGVYLKGVMGYDGHSAKVKQFEERTKVVLRAYETLKEAIGLIKSKGINIEVISVGGTPSTPIWAKFDEITELQPGTYIYNDVHQVEVGVAKKQECALKLMATVMSKPTADRAVIDAGSKSFAFDQGRFPQPEKDLNAQFVSFSEEHGVLKSFSGELSVDLGDKLSFIPYHACTIVDLWDEVYLIRNEKVITKLKIEARGARS
jgi:D-serine deaminase-like pyridoxal phosphate-dependent protein